MKLVLVGLGNSPHLVDTVARMRTLNWDVHVVSSIEAPWATGYERCTLHHTTSGPPPPTGPDVAVVDHRGELGSMGSRAWPGVLAQLIADVGPDIVHAHELQHSGVLTLRARRRMREAFPLFVLSTWGSDIYHFARDPGERAKVRAVLASCDVVWADCWRDRALATAEGFRGPMMNVTPVGGGYDVEAAFSLRTNGPTSARRDIAVKGFNTWVGRGMNALDALDMCGGLIADRQIFLLLSDDATRSRAEQVCARHGATLRILQNVPKTTILAALGRCRVSVALNMSDGTSKGFLESLLCGAFPVQSFSSAAGEWTTHGESAFLVDPTDIRGVAAAVRAALTDDGLVDRAREINDATVRAHLDAQAIGAAITSAYRRLGELARSRQDHVIEAYS